MSQVKLAVIGSRDFTNYLLLKAELEPFKDKIQVIISGGAKGADTLAEKFADEFGIPKLIYPADWDNLGKKAGFIRNKQIIDSCEAVVAFWDGKSKGTKHSIELAEKQGKPVKIIEINANNKNDPFTKPHPRTWTVR
jgi:predicted Rossmann fold nucleotide-binding protein DprA/Smf involved in DNA uptake